MRRIGFLIWKELLELRQDPRLFGIVVMAPIIQLVALAYAATTDHPTLCNLTNHSYFNLKGAGNGDILDQRLRLGADFYMDAEPDNTPTGEIRKVAGTPSSTMSAARRSSTVR